MMLSTCKRNII